MPSEPQLTSPPPTLYKWKIPTVALLYSMINEQIVDLPAKSLISALGRDAYVN